MSTRNRGNYAEFVIGLFCFCSIAASTAGQSLRVRRIFPSTEFRSKKPNGLKMAKLRLRFKRWRQHFTFVPGQAARTTTVGIELTFVQSSIKRKPKVLYPASYTRHGNSIHYCRYKEPTTLPVVRKETGEDISSPKKEMIVGSREACGNKPLHAELRASRVLKSTPSAAAN